MPAGCYLDANLLVLLVVGATDTGADSINIVACKPSTRLTMNVLVGLLGNYQQVLVTPNTLTETSNLLSQPGEPQRSQVLSIRSGH